MTEETMGQEAPEMGDQGDIEKNKGMAVLSYIGILCLIPLLAAKESKYAQFHAKQGLVLLIAWVIAGFIWAVPVVGWMLSPLVDLFLLILAIMGIVYSLQGKYWKMPVLGGMAEKFKF